MSMGQWVPWCSLMAVQLRERGMCLSQLMERIGTAQGSQSGGGWEGGGGQGWLLRMRRGLSHGEKEGYLTRRVGFPPSVGSQFRPKWDSE